jgi:hypothetical protein
MRRTLLLPFLATLGLLACSGCIFPRPTKTATYAQVLNAAKPNFQNTLITVAYYRGSKEGFDYFVVCPPLSREYRYRVLEKDSRLASRFPFTKDRKKWRNWPPPAYPRAFPESLFLPQPGSAQPDSLTNSLFLK